LYCSLVQIGQDEAYEDNQIQMNISALQHDEEAVGKRVKSTKKKFTWYFAVDNDVHCVELYISFMSNRRKIVADGKEVTVKGSNVVPLGTKFYVGRAQVQCLNEDGAFDLEIEGKKFSVLYKELADEPKFEEVKVLFDAEATSEDAWASFKPSDTTGVAGLGFETWDKLYEEAQKSKAAEPETKPESLYEDLLSFEEIPEKPVPQPNTQDFATVDMASLQQYAYMQQLSQMQMVYQMQLAQSGLMGQTAYYR